MFTGLCHVDIKDNVNNFPDLWFNRFTTMNSDVLDLNFLVYRFTGLQ